MDRLPTRAIVSCAVVNLLGATLPDRKLVKIALLAFYGINHRTSSRIMARLQFHDQLRVSDLTEPQLNALSALLSAPAAAPRPSTPLLPFTFSPTASSASASSSVPPLTPRDPPPVSQDPIPSLLLEEDLRRARRADIAHHRTVGTLKGRQHAMGLPRNRTNAKTAKKLNRIERRGFATSATGGQAGQASASFSRSAVLDGLRSLHLSAGRPSLSSVFRS
ncbi:SPOSA6832_00855 [Sporobolomyces salmonicolor]|uniref:SPOSA6832_00855-mRNA-1:cds n=1 Tax=Sporidiobolus salmonicolor TaxID=5005 RepID=A0A0D6EH37_SPOSA|nr:SPOSA6832_00855 [Sporobolomyces salmonicolor]